MSSLDALPHDQQAVLSLLLKQGKSYDDIGALLHIDREAVRWRAHNAVNALGPPDPEGTPEGVHWQVIDYLLGQQTASERAATREALEASPEDRAWARGVAAELRPLSAEDLPEIPAEAAEVDEAFQALDERTAAETEDARKSRLGGILLLGGLGLLVAIAVILAISGGSSKKTDNAVVSTPTAVVHPTTATSTVVKTTPGKTTTTPAKTTTTPGKTTTTTAPAKTTTVTTTAKPPTPKPVAQINLAVPGGTAKTPIGVAEILAYNNSQVANIVGQGLPAGGNTFAYAVWLTSPTASHFVGFTPTVKADGKLRVLAPLPANVATFKELEVTKETTSAPTKPGTVVLQGAIPKLPAP
jgi:sigma-70-like protein